MPLGKAGTTKAGKRASRRAFRAGSRVDASANRSFFKAELNQAVWGNALGYGAPDAPPPPPPFRPKPSAAPSQGDDAAAGAKEGVGMLWDAAKQLERSVNILDFDDYRAAHRENWAGIKSTVSNPQQVVAPITQAYDTGGFDKAAAVTPFVVLGMVGTRKPVGGVRVYESRDANGTLQYVGITNDIQRRAREHLNDPRKGISISEIPGLPAHMSRRQARSVEQALIHRYGLGKRGRAPGQLFFNERNSISPLRPGYDQRLAQGSRLLRQAGFPGF